MVRLITGLGMVLMVLKLLGNGTVTQPLMPVSALYFLPPSECFDQDYEFVATMRKPWDVRYPFGVYFGGGDLLGSCGHT